MMATVQQVKAALKQKDLRKVTYLVFSIARNKTDDYFTYDEEAEIDFYYSLKKASKYYPARINLLQYYLENSQAFYKYLPMLTQFFETGDTKELSLEELPVAMGYILIRA